MCISQASVTGYQPFLFRYLSDDHQALSTAADLEHPAWHAWESAFSKLVELHICYLAPVLRFPKTDVE